jgi:hypothetical protein
MNRTERRAIERIHRRRAKRGRRDTHRMPPQICTLYVPAAGGYLADFGPTSFRVVEDAELARLYVEDEASSAALTFREVTGLRVAIRPYYCPHAAHGVGMRGAP